MGWLYSAIALTVGCAGIMSTAQETELAADPHWLLALMTMGSLLLMGPLSPSYLTWSSAQFVSPEPVVLPEGHSRLRRLGAGPAPYEIALTAY